MRFIARYRIAKALDCNNEILIHFFHSVFHQINDFDIPAPVVKSFLHNDNAVLRTVRPNNWCHVLPRCVCVCVCMFC